MAYLFNSKWQLLLNYFDKQKWGRAKQLKWLQIFSDTVSMFAAFDEIVSNHHKLITSSEKNQIRVITILDSDYPNLLKEIDDPPVLLYLLGKNPKFNDQLCVSIIGTRNPTPYGMKIARILVEYFRHPDLTVISGMASGIDALAQTAALKQEMNSIAVLGSGVDICYPGSEYKLYQQLIEQGSIISEYSPGTKPRPYYFPMRNRIISGMSRKLIVVEAGLKSGTMITARYALEQGRDVYAIPGSVFSKTSQGCHQLINDGAKIIMNLDELADFSKQLISGLNHLEQEILNYIKSYNPTFLDLIHYSELQISELLTLLGKLEGIGLITQHNGKYLIA